MEEIGGDKKKSHQKKRAGVSANKKKGKLKAHEENLNARQRNPKAFAIQSAVRAERKFRRKEDLTAKRQHIPLVDKTPVKPPPTLVAIVGPPKVGKTTLMTSLIKSFTKTNVTNINGPITIVTSKKRRITLIECNNDINSMIDIAKCADLILLMCDASFGFEMEMFEFLNICQTHGMPKILGILTHLDAIKNPKTLKHRKKELKHRFWTEVYGGAKLFYLSGVIHGEYLRNEISNLSRFIATMKYHPLTWRGTHGYLLADRMEDITNTETIRLHPKCDRDIVLYGYVRGVPINQQTMFHIAGVGDLRINELSVLPDPCPLPSEEKKRNLLEKERLLYAPMSGVGGIVYDKDAVYIELQGSHSHRKDQNTEQEEIIKELIDKPETFDVQINNQEFKLFSDGDIIKSANFKDNTEVIDEKDDDVSDSDDDDDDGEVVDSGMEDDELDKYSNEIKRNDSSSEDEEDQNEDDSSDEDYQDEVYNDDSNESGESDDEDNHDENNDDENGEDKLMENNMHWKEDLAEKARSAYLERQSNTQNLMKVVYGVFKQQRNKSVIRDDEDDLKSESDADSDADGEIGGLFKVISKKQIELQKEKENRDNTECCFFENYGNENRDWLTESNKNLIVNCFVTGKWRANEDAEELLRLDDLSDADSDLYGDFEDLTTGEKHLGDVGNISAKKDSINSNRLNDEQKTNANKRKFSSRIEETNLTKSELMAKKMKLKEQFDAEYDNKTKGGDDDGRITGDHGYYEELKAEAIRQSEMNKNEFAHLDEHLRIEIEGYRAGLYVRMNFKNMPCEFVTNFDPHYPVLIGSLNMAEENIGYVNCKIKIHRWYKKILKTGDPLILSLGWRRFQTMPIYTKIGDDLKHRYLKYTPNHVTCSMSFWGPITPQNTGILAVQTVQENVQFIKHIGFRIAATGSVTEIGKSTHIMKKLKLIGTPLKIFKKTAFIEGMFTSALEVSKFEGAKIKTVSGIRGQIKKALTTDSHVRKALNKAVPDGSFRATFEDTILLSDIVFCRTWFCVDVPQFYAPVTSLLLPLGQKSQWSGMKTVGELKRERNLRNEINSDSLYNDINRQPKTFKPLKLPKSLQNALPYKFKIMEGTNTTRQRQPFDKNRIAVIHSPHEQKVAKMMKMLKANYEAKLERNKEETIKRKEEFKKQKRKEELRKLTKQKEKQKRVCRAKSKMQKSKSSNRNVE